MDPFSISWSPLWPLCDFPLSLSGRKEPSGCRNSRNTPFERAFSVVRGPATFSPFDTLIPLFGPAVIDPPRRRRGPRLVLRADREWCSPSPLN